MSASVQFMITNAMRATLVEELEFEPEEVDVMRPEIAAELIEKKMKRPFGDRPMPDQGKRDYDGGGDGDRRRGFGLGPVGDLFRSLFYMSVVAGFCLGVACGASPEVRKWLRGYALGLVLLRETQAAEGEMSSAFAPLFDANRVRLFRVTRVRRRQDS